MSDNLSRFDRSPLSDAPPAVRATYSPAQRLEIANYCGPDSARTVPMDTGREHGPSLRAQLGAGADPCHGSRILRARFA